MDNKSEWHEATPAEMRLFLRAMVRRARIRRRKNLAGIFVCVCSFVGILYIYMQGVCHA